MKETDNLPVVNPLDTEESKNTAKALKKAAAKAEKDAKKAARAQLAQQQQRALDEAMNKQVLNVEEDIYGFLPSVRSTYRTDRIWTKVSEIDESIVGKSVWVRARLHSNRCKGSLGFIVLRNQMATIQGILDSGKNESITKECIKWTGSLSLESIVDVYGTVVKPDIIISGTTQTTELHVQKIHCVSVAASELPFQLKDANRPEIEGETDEEGVIRVAQDTRLDNRILDLRTTAQQAILRISSSVCTLFREFLLSKSFIEIHSPKLIGGTSEGGTNVFKLQYFGSPACLAQSPQLYKQMAISSDLNRVFEIAPVFRAENSNTHRHMCEFTGLDLEMAFNEHYFEVLEMLEGVFIHIFKGLNERCKLEIEAVRIQYPSEPFQFSEKVLRLDFEEGLQLLRDAGNTNIPEDISSFDISTEQEKALGRLVREKYKTDFYYMVNYPLNVRPFYTMPNAKNPLLSNSYDFFMRGEEILSGAQRIHEPDFLTQRAKECGIDVNTIKDYIKAFSLGAYPHAGAGVGLERVVMLFLGLQNIRKTSMFPRDPKRLTP